MFLEEENTSTIVQDREGDIFDHHDWSERRYSMMAGANAMLRRFEQMPGMIGVGLLLHKS